MHKVFLDIDRIQHPSMLSLKNFNIYFYYSLTIVSYSTLGYNDPANTGG